jgi:ATP-dependent DNA helicase DinG
MLSSTQKDDIRRHYSTLCENKSLISRWGQKVMIAEIAKTLGGIETSDEDERSGDNHVCVVEAGTGTGKTLAYALTCLYMAKSLNKKLVISTATVALQEQIVLKDLPDLLRHSGMDFQFALAKGRGRYLCLSKLESAMEGDENPQAALYPDEVIAVSSGDQQKQLYQQMVSKLAANQWDGDRDSWEDSIEAEYWQPLTSDHHQCSGRKCPHIKNCFYFKARENLDDVDCVITNHDLVLADLALGGGAILPAPADTIYVFDEGHHLPDKALQHFAHHSRLISTRKWLEQAEKAMANLVKVTGVQGEIGRIIQSMSSAYQNLREQMAMVKAMVEPLFGDVAESNSRNGIHHRFDNGIIPLSLRDMAISLKADYIRLTDGFERILKELDEVMGDNGGDLPKHEAELWYPAVGMLRNRADGNAQLWTQYAIEDEVGKPPMGRWISYLDNAGGDFEICASPIMASHTLYSHLWSRCFGAVVTSATLSALGSFERFIRRSGVPRNSNMQRVDSPFNYPEAAELIVPNFIDPSNSQAHTEAIIDDLPNRFGPTEAALVLFSSRKQMRDVYFELPHEFREKVLLQDDYSKHALISKHRKTVDEGRGSVIFGLASMAEGVDLPGDYCRYVVIAKIPFAVPDDPVEAALSEWVQAGGGNPFMEITVPDAAIKLVQACGRLLRNESDTGKVAILDSRLLSRRYGKAILNSLPPFTQRLG